MTRWSLGSQVGGPARAGAARQFLISISFPSRGFQLAGGVAIDRIRDKTIQRTEGNHRPIKGFNELTRSIPTAAVEWSSTRLDSLVKGESQRHFSGRCVTVWSPVCVCVCVKMEAVTCVVNMKSPKGNGLNVSVTEVGYSLSELSITTLAIHQTL